MRYVNVIDVGLMATKLDNIIFEGRKLVVNLPRFHKAAKESGKPLNKFVPQRGFTCDGKEVGVQGKSLAGKVHIRTFAEDTQNLNHSTNVCREQVALMRSLTF